MKKILIASALLSSLMLAGTTATDSNSTKGNSTKIDELTRVETMQKLEKSMEKIQKGFFYNNTEMVKNAVKDFKGNLKNMDAFILGVEEIENGRNFKPKQYAEKEVKALNKLSDEIITAYKKDRKDRATRTYKKMIDRCLTCHRIIRKW